MSLIISASHSTGLQHNLSLPSPSLLSAVGNPKVNYLSLDIEGAELQVLRSIPWHLVDIEVEDHPSNATFSLHPSIHYISGYYG